MTNRNPYNLRWTSPLTDPKLVPVFNRIYSWGTYEDSSGNKSESFILSCQALADHAISAMNRTAWNMNSVVTGPTTEQTLPNILAAMRKSSVVVGSSHGVLNEILTSHFIEGGLTKSVTGTTPGIGIIENRISTKEPVNPDLMARSNMAETPRYLNLFFAYSCKTIETDTPLTMDLPIGAEVDNRPNAAYAGFSKVVYTGVANDFLPELRSQITNWSYLSEHFKRVAQRLAIGETVGTAIANANSNLYPIRSPIHRLHMLSN